MEFINEYRYTIEDTKLVHNAYYAFFPKTQTFHYLSLLLAAVAFFIFFQTSLKRFAIFGLILLVIFFLRYLRSFFGARYDAARIKEETGVTNPMIRCELGSDLKVYRDGKLHFTAKFEEMIGAKETRDAVIIFTNRNYTALFKNGFFLEGGGTALKAYLRENGVNVK